MFGGKFQNVWREAKNGNVEWLRFLSIESHTGNSCQIPNKFPLLMTRHKGMLAAKGSAVASPQFTPTEPMDLIRFRNFCVHQRWSVKRYFS